MTTKIMECDLVVLGAGGAGLVAAVKASEDGVKKVIVLEKAKKAGGATYYAGGPGVGSQGGGGMGGAPGRGQSGKQGSQGGMPQMSGTQGGQGSSGGPQGEMPGGQGGQSGQGGMPQMGGQGGQGGSGTQYTTAQFSNWFTKKVGSENFVKTARMEKYINLPDPSIGPGRGGTFAIVKMLEFCQKQGIQVLYETPAIKFITDTKGKITGVLANAKDGQVQVNCKTCIIASGGFGRNYEKLKKYWPEEYNNKEIFFLCPPGMMGDGIDMAEAAGAYIDQTKWKMSDGGGFFASGPIHHPYSWAVQSLMSGSGFVSINLEGKRWKNESGGPASVSLAGQPGGVAYSVADSDIVEAAGAQLLSGGGGGPMGMSNDPNSSEAKAIKKWREDLEYEVAIDEDGTHGNHAKKANTLVELALKMDINPATFVETIERYNKFCEAGKDLDFGKDAQSLKAIKKPPFYSIYGHRYSQCTKGLYGIAVSSDFEVLNPKGDAMPGLYAAGDTCTIYGGLAMGPGGRGNSSSGETVPPGSKILSTTPSPCQGSMAALMSGYSAGVHAAEYLKKI
jgi:succinate dehydrogenase/fumarate reductase flavoprotein subunit